MDDHIRPLTRTDFVFIRLLSFIDRDGIRHQRKFTGQPTEAKERKDSPWQKNVYSPKKKPKAFPFRT